MLTKPIRSFSKVVYRKKFALIECLAMLAGNGAVKIPIESSEALIGILKVI